MGYNNTVSNIIALCTKNYDQKTFDHCLRVANYAVDNVCLRSSDEKKTAFTFALCHDLLEDTSVTVMEISVATGYSVSFIKDILGALTKTKDETYIEYIERLKTNKSIYPYIIKLADMKDHLVQTETLTDRLKEKYWNALPYLL